MIELLRNNDELKNELLKTVGEFLRRVDATISNISFNTDDNGDLIIKYTLERLISSIVPKGYLQIYANIASNLSLDQINDFCKNNREFHEVCKDEIFWFTLFKERYLYKETTEQYDWERVYKAALYYENKDNELDKIVKEYNKEHSNMYTIDLENPFTLGNYWRKITNSFSQGLRYLMKYNIFDFDLDDVGSMLRYTDDVDAAKYILDNYKIDNVDLSSALREHQRDPEFLRLFFNYKSTDKEGNVVELNKNKVRVLYRRLEHSETHPITVDLFKVYYDFLDGSYNTNLDYLSSMAKVDPETLEYILNRLPENIPTRTLIKTLRFYIYNLEIDKVKGLFNKYRSSLTEKDVQNLKQYTKDLFTSRSSYTVDSDPEKQLLDIFV